MQGICLLQFRALRRGDLAELLPYFVGKGAIAADYSILYFYMWNGFLRTEYVIEDDVLYLRRNTRHGIFYYPPLRRDSRDLLADIPLLSRATDEATVSLCAIPEHEAERVETSFAVLEKDTSRRWADYIYAAEDLATLRGHRYNKKRNLVNQFKKLYEGRSYEPLSSENVEEAAQLLHRIMDASEMSEDERFENERVLEVLADYSKLPLCGGLVRVDGVAVAFCVAERIDDVLVVHIEKADRAYKGAYQYINYRFAKEQYADGSLALINREDDTGDEGLRHAKLSYFPVNILHKYRMVLKNDFGGGAV